MVKIHIKDATRSIDFSFKPVVKCSLMIDKESVMDSIMVMGEEKTYTQLGRSIIEELNKMNLNYEDSSL